MAIPRIFISSTYYDLKHIRNDLESFITGLGYEPVMHERGGVPYTQDKPLEQSCYDEIANCDILICIIGNKFGTQSDISNHSITMEELQTAIKSQKIIYICIQKDVALENRTYLANKGNSDFIPVYADDKRIHEFIGDLKNVVKNHPILEFDNVSEIINNLKQQFAGLFLNLLRTKASITESSTLYDLKETSDEIKNSIADFNREKDEFLKKFDTTIYANNVLTRNLFRQLGFKDAIVYTRTISDFKDFLFNIGFEFKNNFPELTFTRSFESTKEIITLSEDAINEDGTLIVIRTTKQAEELLKYTVKETDCDDFSDDIPF